MLEGYMRREVCLWKARGRLPKGDIMFIKRKEAEDAIIRYLNERDEHAGEPYRKIFNPSIAKLTLDDIQNFRAIEVRPKQRWINIRPLYPSDYVKKCSYCGHETENWKDNNYCPKCGSEMEKE